MKRIAIAILVTISALVSCAQSSKAEIERLKAEIEAQRRLAWENQRKAEMAEKNAERLRYQSISISMANKSKVIHDDELAGLLTLQAYRFNRTHGGYTYENNLFLALTNMLNRFGYDYKSTSLFVGNPQNMDLGIDFSSPNGVLVIRKGGFERSLYGHMSKVIEVVYAHSGRFIASIDNTGVILIWNVQDGSKEPLIIQTDKGSKNLEFSEDDSELRVALSSKSERVWSLSSDLLATELEKFLTRNLSHDEWQIYVAPDLPYEKTVARLPQGLDR